MNREFVFTGRERTFCFVLMGIGVLSMVLCFFGDDELQTRFWSNFLHNSVFFTGIAFMALFLYSAFITGWSGWHIVFKRVWEGIYLFLPVGLILMLIIAAGLWLDFHHLYEWNDTSALNPDKLHDQIILGKTGFLNKFWFTGGTILFVGIWYFIATRLRGLSVAEDNEERDPNFSKHRKMRIWAAAILPIGGFTSAFLIWQWVMSVDSAWYSTMFAWYAAASWLVSMLCLTAIFTAYLKGRGYLEQVSHEHLHDMGKYIFAFSIFWTYLWFSQFMLIWYANVGEETIYFRERMDSYPILFWANLAVNFALPFLVLMRNSTKRKYGSLLFIASVVFIGHWMDFFLMIKPGVRKTAEHLTHAAGDAHHGAASFMSGFTIPGFIDIGTMLGFLGLFIFVVFSNMSRASLYPANDPYLAESIHHHV